MKFYLILTMYNIIIYIYCNLDHSLISRVTISGTRWCIYSIKGPDDEHNTAKHVEEYDRFNKEIVHQVGKQDFYCIRMHGQKTIKKPYGVHPEGWRGLVL